MKKLGLILLFIVLIFPFNVHAKTINIKANIASDIKNVDINEVIVSLEKEDEPEGTIEYSLLKKDNYILTINDFPDNAPVEFVYGSIVINKKIDSVGRYVVKCKEIMENGGVYNIVVSVEDSKSTTTTTVTQVAKETEKDNKFSKELAYYLMIFIVLALLIFGLIFLIKIKKADNMY